MTPFTISQAREAACNHATIARQWTAVAQSDAGDPIQARRTARWYRWSAHQLRSAIRKARRGAANENPGR
jgi:hypothetical protein